MADDFDYDPSNDEDLEDEDLEEELDEEEYEDSEEDQDEQSQLEERVKDRQGLNRLKKISKTAPYRFYPHLTREEKNLVNSMKKKHSREVAKLEQVMAERKQAFWGKAKAVITPAIPFIIFGIIAIFIIIIVVTIIGFLFPWLFPGDENLGGGSGASSPFGIKGDKFYGARAVYKDDTLARNGLIEQYVDIVETSVEKLQAETYTEIVEVDGENKTYDVKLTINLTLPAKDFDYSNLDLTKFASVYAVLYNVVEDMAKLSYKVDNDGAEAPADLVETLDGVKYFGFNEDMIGESIVDDDVDKNIIEIVYDALTENGVITLEEKLQSATDYTAAENVTIESFDDNLRSELVEIINVPKNKVRAEKLFIKDFILENADSYMEGIEKKNYVALIYMPKESVNFDYLSYMITIDKNAEFSIVLTNNGSEISLTKNDGENWGEDKNPTELAYKYDSGENLNQTVNAADIINMAYLNKFTSATSLATVIVDEEIDYNTYLEQTTNDDGEKVLTYKKGNMYLTFETDAEFMFNDEMTY